jgi:hypothetical protein
MSPQMRFYVSLYLAIAGFYLLTVSGRIGLSDGVAMFNVTQSIVQDGSFSSDPCDPDPVGHPNHCVPGKNGRHYAGFGLLPSIVAAPAVLSARFAANLEHVNTLAVMRLSVSLFTALISPLVCAILAMWVVGLGYSRKTAALSAGILAFASPFWHFAIKGFYSEPYFTLGLLLAAYLASCSRTFYMPVLAGLAFGAACGARINGISLFPAFVLFFFLKNRERKLPQNRLLTDLGCFSFSFAACMALIAWSNYARFGDVLKTGYQVAFPSASALLANPLLRGMGELLFDNEVGLFVFVPWTILALFCFFRFVRTHGAESALCGAICLFNFVFFAKYASWHGGMVAGPRFLVATLPFLVMFTVPYLEDLKQQNAVAHWGRRVLRVVAAGLVAIAFLIQGLGVLYPETRYYVLSRYYEDQPAKPWWTGSIPLASLDFLSQMRSEKESFSGPVAPLTADPVAVSRQEQMLFASMRGAASEQEFLRSFPNSENLILPDLILVKARVLGLPKSAWFAYLLACASTTLLGLIGIGKYSESGLKIQRS